MKENTVSVTITDKREGAEIDNTQQLEGMVAAVVVVSVNGDVSINMTGRAGALDYLGVIGGMSDLRREIMRRVMAE